MAFNIIIGDTSTGKSNKICKMMVEQSLALPSERFIVIVPEQATLLMQKKVIDLHPKHAVSNIDIVSFNYLAHMVFSELGENPDEVLDDTGKSLILKKVLNEIKEDLVVYKTKANMQGFIDEMSSMVSELSQYDIDDNDLFLMQEAAEEQGNKLLYAKLDDIRLIYRSFLEKVSEKYVTAEEILDILSRLSGNSELIKGSHIFLDGFTGFTPIQYKIIEQFACFAIDVTLTITLPEEKTDEDCPEYELFNLSNRTYKRVREIALKEKQDVNVISCKKDADDRGVKNAIVHASKTTEDEVIYTAGKILDLIREEGMRFRDIAVIVSDMEEYHRIIRRIFNDAGISFFIDHKSRLSENALSGYLLSALRLVEERASFDSLFSYLKSGLSGLTADEISRLENYCLEFGIKGMRAFEEDFYKNRKKDPWKLDELNEVRKKTVSELKDFYHSFKGTSSSAKDHQNAILMLFERNGIRQKLEEMAETFVEDGELSLSEEYENIYEQVTGLLDKVSIILSDEKLSTREYADIISEGLGEVQIGVAPPALDAVVVGDLTRTRNSDIKAMFVIGANEGKLPKASGGSVIFTQREREFLKSRDFEIAPTILENIYIQRYYIYLAFMKPEKYLYITYAAVSPDGSSLLPSYVAASPEEVAEGLERIEDKQDAIHSWKALELSKLALNIKDPDEEMLNYFAKEDAFRLDQILDGAFFTNRENRLDKAVAEQLYGKILKGSVSRYERFNECPFRHFMQYGLKAQPRAEYEVGVFDIGNIYHDSLEKYSTRLEAEKKNFRDISDEESHRIIKECVDEAVSNIGNDALSATARSEYMLKRIHEVAEKTTDMLREHIRNGKYEPEHFEWTFNSEAEGGLSFAGKIDRIDIYDGDDVFVKIIDYKSGNKTFDIKEVYTGSQLQLAAYMDEALKSVKKEYPNKNVYPGGIYYYIVGDKYIKEDEDAKIMHAMNGLTNTDEEALAAIDINANASNPGKSEVVNITYDSKGIKNNASVANREEFLNLIDFVKKKMTDTGRRIKEGDVDVAPVYSGSQSNACIYCDYKGVCKFEDEKFGVGFNRALEDKETSDINDEVYGKKTKSEEED